MQHSLIAKLIGFLLFFPLSINPALSKNIDNRFLSNQLETILNQKKYGLMKELFLQKPFNSFKKEYIDFQKKYKDAKWSIKTISIDQNFILLDVEITSKREISDQIYNLNSKQTVEMKILRNKITS